MPPNRPARRRGTTPALGAAALVVAGLAPLAARTAAPAAASVTAAPERLVARAAPVKAALSSARFATTGGRLVVRLSGIPALSTCAFSSGAGVVRYGGSFACAGRFVHVGIVRPNSAGRAHRWTVRASVTTRGRLRRFAWVISVAARPVPSTSTTSPATTTTSTSPPTTSPPPPPSSVPPSSPVPSSPAPGSPAPGSLSSNWAGYSLQGSAGSVSEVGASFTVPTLNCAATPQGQDAEWVGVDGTSGDSLFQAGVASSCASGIQQSTAWYEDIQGNPPDPAQELFTVSPGDLITAQVQEISPGSWQYAVSDVTSGQSSSASMPFDGPAAAADWIEEDPATETSGGSIHLLPYADFGGVSFTNLSLNGQAPSLDLGADGISLVQSGQLLALPSPPSGDGFGVTYQG